MNKLMKRVAVSAFAAGMVACTLCGVSIPVNAAETGKAYLHLTEVVGADSDKTYARYEGPDNTNNTIKAGIFLKEVKDEGEETITTFDADGTYTAEIDLKEAGFDTIGEISKLQLYVYGTENTKNAEITLDSVKINGSALDSDAVKNVKVNVSGNNFYFDLCDSNGTTLIDRKEYIDVINKVEATFTVSGWSSDGGNGGGGGATTEPATEAVTSPANVETTAPTPATSPAPSTTPPSPSGETTDNVQTGDNRAVAVGTALMVAAVLSAVTFKKKQ